MNELKRDKKKNKLFNFVYGYLTLHFFFFIYSIKIIQIELKIVLIKKNPGKDFK